MLEGFVLENTGIVLIIIIVIAFAITYLVHKQSIEYLLSKTIRRVRKQLLQQDNEEYSQKRPNLPLRVWGECTLYHSQSSAQRPKQETTKIEREINQE